ncbi:MAG TPA: alkaline phosphatase D family protein [Actinomycetes bacterium]|nr:alkaline phosphatase D family protein [Actinomycetes bacterium]
MSNLVLGPLLRYVGRTCATVWLEADRPGVARVELVEEGSGAVVAARSPTFHVLGHHYALVVVEGLEPGRTYRYGVDLGAGRVWPPPGSGFPPSVIHTLGGDHALRIAFGSCRQSDPQAPGEDPQAIGPAGRRGQDALVACAQRLLDQPTARRPDALLLLGDQLYADEAAASAATSFEGFTRLYRVAWQQPAVRWLLSTVPTAMIFDDHDIQDDWNTSQSWVEHIRAQPWWHGRIVGGLMSYWLYQHLGNLAPEDLRADQVWAELRAARDGGPALAAYAERADQEPGAQGTRWSFRRDFGRVRLVVVDSRCGRLLAGGRRDMLHPAEWSWLDAQLRGDVDHLLLGTSLPYLLPRAIHDLEAWNEAVCAGAWGRVAARLGERVRQGLDLEHWAAFRGSFERLAGLIAAVGAGERGAPPASIVLLSGDVHHAYLAEADFPPARGVTSRVFQAVCSPLHNRLQPSLQRVNRLATGRPGRWLGRLLAAGAHLPPPPVDWRVTHGPFYDNQIATLTLDGPAATLRLERAVARDGQPALETVLEQPLTSPAPRPAADGTRVR